MVLMTPINKEHTHLPYITYIVLLKKIILIIIKQW